MIISFMSHTDPRKMVCGIKVIFSIDKIGINGVIYFFFTFVVQKFTS